MPRTYIRTTARASYTRADLKEALEKIRQGQSLLSVSKSYGINRRTLRRHRDGTVQEPGMKRLGRFDTCLGEKYEKIFAARLKYMQNRLFGLTTIDCRKLAYSFAEEMKINHRFSKSQKMAGRDWLQGFMKRNTDLSLRKPQGTNIARAAGFNRIQVRNFFLANSTQDRSGIWMRRGLPLCMHQAK
ncbi:Uncharacterised protein r2_g781 [Pycnogonum litorale]